MTTNATYTTLAATLPDDALAQKIIAVLKDHVGSTNRIARRDLLMQAFPSARLPVNLSNSTEDRKIRLTIEDLQAAGYPVLSDSGAGGYWLGTPEEIETYVAELESRREKLTVKIRALRTSKGYTLWRPNAEPVQTGLWG